MPAAMSALSTRPGTPGTTWMPAATDKGSTGPSNVIPNDDPTPTRLPWPSLAAIVAAVDSRVRNAARAGLAIGAPVAASAPASTVIV